MSPPPSLHSKVFTASTSSTSLLLCFEPCAVTVIRYMLVLVCRAWRWTGCVEAAWLQTAASERADGSSWSSLQLVTSCCCRDLMQTHTHTHAAGVRRAAWAGGQSANRAGHYTPAVTTRHHLFWARRLTQGQHGCCSALTSAHKVSASVWHTESGVISQQQIQQRNEQGKGTKGTENICYKVTNRARQKWKSST